MLQLLDVKPVTRVVFRHGMPEQLGPLAREFSFARTRPVDAAGTREIYECAF